MQVYTKYILFLFLLSVSFPSLAQKVKVQSTASTKYAQGVSSTDRQEIVKTTEALLNEYTEAATLLDPSKRRVNGTSIDRFRTLFNPTANIMKDYEENYQGELINVRVYADGVYNRMERDGIKVRVGKVTLKSINDDPAGYWVVVLEVEKIFYNAVTAKQEVKEIASGRYVKQEFRVDVKKTDLSRAKISGIKCVGCEQEIVADYVRYAGPSIGVYTGSFSPSLSSFWNNNHSTSDLSTSAKLGFSFGGDFMTNRFSSSKSGAKNLFVTAGLHFALFKLSTELSDFALAPFAATAIAPTGVELPYSRIGSAISATENLSVSVIEIPLGVMYRLKKGIKSDFMVGLKLIPSFVLSGSADINGLGTYDAELSDAMWRLLEDGATNLAQIDTDNKFAPFQAGVDQVINQSGSPSTAGFLLTARLSPTYYMHLSEDDSSWSLLLGLDLNMHLGSFLSHDDANTEILKFRDDYDTSLLQHYTDGMSGFTFGFRIGLHHRLTSQP